MAAHESDTLITVAARTTASVEDVCGWVSGSRDSALTCNPGQRCGIDTERRLVGCCWTGENGDECSLSTRCVEGGTYVNLHSAAKDRELVCYGDRAPYCKTNVFASDGDLSGYSLFICDTDRVRETVWRHLVETGSVKSTLGVGTGSGASSSTAHATSLALPVPSPSSLPSAHMPASTGAPVPSMSSTSTYPVSASSSPRFGALGNDVGSLVGTVVGGAAFVAAAGGVTLWLTLKLKNKLRLSVGRQRCNNADEERQRARIMDTAAETGTMDDTTDGYLHWRTKQKSQAANAVASLLASAPVHLPSTTCARVAALVHKHDLAADAEAQVLEDVACMVFLDDQLDAFDAKPEIDEDKMVGILNKTWSKMSEQGRQLALSMQLSDRAQELVAKALHAPEPL